MVTTFDVGALGLGIAAGRPFRIPGGRRTGRAQFAAGRNRSNEAITSFRHSLNYRPTPRATPKRLAQQRYVHAEVDLLDDEARPYLREQFVFGGKVSGATDQRD